MTSEDLTIVGSACDRVLGVGIAAKIEPGKHPNSRAGAMIVQMTGLDPTRRYHLGATADALRRLALERCDGSEVLEAFRQPLARRSVALCAVIAQPDESSPPTAMHTSSQKLTRHLDLSRRATSVRQAKEPTTVATLAPRTASPPPRHDLHGRDLLVHTLEGRTATARAQAPAPMEPDSEPMVDRTRHRELSGRDRLIQSLKDRES